ncbi:MAG: ferritin family protein [Deltaproteobacteria bacterium]|nr:ferritin family protein [Deltaproteobacteria bacterium]
MEEVCYTREVALEKAIEMERKSFEEYREAYFMAKDPLAKDLLKDLALDELRHKYTLEKAFFEEKVLLHDSGANEGPSMKFTLLFEDRPLGKESTEQDVFLHAIHEEKRAVDFYSKTAESCGGAPMAEMFKRLAQDEEGHLARLEELYESVYLKEM